MTTSFLSFPRSTQLRIVLVCAFTSLFFWIGAICLQAQDPEPEPTPNPDQNMGWIPPGNGSTTPEPTPIPDGTPDPDNSSGNPPANGGATPPPFSGNRNVNATVEEPTPTPPLGGAANALAEPEPNADIPDPEANLDVAPAENTPYDQGQLVFHQSLADTSDSDSESYKGTFLSGLEPETNAQSPTVPAPEDITPTTNTDVSTISYTGCGYDIFTGAARRTVTDIEVAGALGTHPLRWARTYSSRNNGWAGSFGWRLYGKPFGSPDRPFFATLSDGRSTSFRQPAMNDNAYRAAKGTKERLVLHDDAPVNGISRTGTADLYLEDGSVVHFKRSTDTSTNDQFLIDAFTPQWVKDPYGLKQSLVYEQIPGEWEATDIRLRQVIEENPAYPDYPNTTYASQKRSLTFVYDNYKRLQQVISSDGQSVTYGYQPGGSLNLPLLQDVSYSDGTSASYHYATAAVEYNDVPGAGGVGQQSVLFTAEDTRAKGAMRSIQYEYPALSPSHFGGQIKSEKHYPGGQVASTFVQPGMSGGDRTLPTDVRGDGSSRDFFLQYDVDLKTPWLKWRTDFRGNKEYFEYDQHKYVNKFTDRNNNVTLYLNEPILGNPTKITYGTATNSPHIDYTYSNNQTPYHVASVTDELGRKTTYHRDLLNRVYQVDYPDSSHEYFEFNGFGQVTKHVRKNGAVEYADYNTRGQLTRLWNPLPAGSERPEPTSPLPKTAYTYHPLGDPWADRLKSVTPPPATQADGAVVAPDILSYEYDRHFTTGVRCAGRGLVTRIGHSNGLGSANANAFNTYEAFGYDKWGNKLWEENEMTPRQRTTYTYDDYNRILSVSRPPPAANTTTPSSVTTYDYRATNSEAATSAYTHTTANWKVKTVDGIQTQQLYDNNLRLTSMTKGLGTAAAATTTYDYDPNGNQTIMRSPRSSAFTTITTYDERNRKKTVTNPLVDFEQWDYDAAGNVVTFHRLDGKTEVKTYDTMHRILTDRDPEGRITQFAYYPSGKLRYETNPNGYGPTVPNGYTTKFYYDNEDRKIQMNYPGDAATQKWLYDERGNLIWRKTAYSSIIQTFRYDSRDRKVRMDLGTIVSGNTMQVDSTKTQDWGAFTYNAADQILTADNGNSLVTRIYDTAGRLAHDRQRYKDLAGTNTREVRYQYINNKVSRSYVPTGSYDFHFGYDGQGRLETLTHEGALEGVVDFRYYYDKASNVTRRYNYFNGTEVAYTYDAADRTSDLAWKRPGSYIAREHYTVDEMNRLKRVDRYPGAANTGAVSDNFTYDLAGQIKTANYGWKNPARSVTYNWDDAGNRTSVVETGPSVSKTYTPNAYNQYTAVTGEVIHNGSEHEIDQYKAMTYKYYGDTYLSSVTSGSNTYQLYYDALGRCVERKTNGVAKYYLYDGEHWIVEYDGTGAFSSIVLYGLGIDEVLWRWIGLSHFPLPDRNGNTAFITGDIVNGAAPPIREQYRYDAFGAPTYKDATGYDLATQASAIGNRFLFTGREYNSLFGFYEYRARAYHPGLGRFMSEDPIGFAAGDYNLYRYCMNDPLDLADPTGLLVILNDPYNKTKEVYDRTLKDKSEFARSYERAREHDTHNRDGTINKKALNAFNAIEKSKTLVVTITRTKALRYDPHAQFAATFNRRTGEGSASFVWNPNQARENTNLTRNSPGAVLLHEVWHAERIVNDPGGASIAFRHRNFGSASPEEKRVLELEQQVFPHLQNEGARSDLNFQRFFDVSDPAFGGRE